MSRPKTRRKPPLAFDLRDWMTVEQVAIAHDVSTATVWRWRQQKKLTTQRILGRTLFRRSDVEALGRSAVG